MNYCQYCGGPKGIGPCPCEVKRERAAELERWNRVKLGAQRRLEEAEGHLRRLRAAP